MMQSIQDFFARAVLWARPVALSLLVFIAIAAVVSVSLLLLIRFYRGEQKRLAAVRWLRLKNQGNADALFQIHPQTESPKVRLSVLHEGVELEYALSARRLVETEPELQEDEEPAQQEQAESIPASAPVQKAEPAKAKPGGAALKRQVNGLIGFWRTLGGLLGAIGSLLPGSLGEGLRSQARQIQQMSQDAGRLASEPEQKKRQLEHIQNGVQSLGGKNGPGRPKQPAQIANPSATERPQQVVVSPERLPASAQSAGRGAAYSTQGVVQKGVFQTAAVAPGESVMVSLVCTPANIYWSESVRVLVNCRQVALSGEKELQSVGQMEAIREMELKGLPAFRSLLNFLLFGLVAGVDGAAIFFLIRWLVENVF